MRIASRIVRIFVAPAQHVKAGDSLVAVEAMKTEHVLRAPKDGIVKRVCCTMGELVGEGKVLVEFEDDAADVEQ